jgi:transposase
MSSKRSSQPRSIEVVNPEAAGIDVGAEVHYVAVNPQRSSTPIRRFSAMTDGIHALIAFLKESGTTTVVLESTGPYWGVLYAELAKADLRPLLVDPRKAKKPAGRKTDVVDSEWLRQMHVLGMLDGAFVATGHGLQMRELVRRRQCRIAHQGAAVVMMQEALSRMNVKLQHVVRDLAGKTGLAIVDAVLAGERDPRVLAMLRDYRCRSDETTFVRAMTGTWREECLLILRQARDDHRHYQSQIDECDRAIETLLNTIITAQPAATIVSPSKPKPSSNKHAPSFNAHQLLATIYGVDLTTIPGVNATSLLKLSGEIGFTIDPWPTPWHFASWLRLCPDPQRSGDKPLRKRGSPATATRAAQIFKEMALGLHHDQGPLGQRFRAVRARKGHDFAIKVAAHQIAVIAYCMIKTKRPFDPTHHQHGIDDTKQRQLNALRKKAQALGYSLQEVTAKAAG